MNTVLLDPDTRPVTYLRESVRGDQFVIVDGGRGFDEEFLKTDLREVSEKEAKVQTRVDVQLQTVGAKTGAYYWRNGRNTAWHYPDTEILADADDTRDRTECGLFLEDLKQPFRVDFSRFKICWTCEPTVAGQVRLTDNIKEAIAAERFNS